MSGIIVSILFSVAVQLVRFGIGTLYEARKLRRPNLRDKEGTRAYLENLLSWAAYIHRSFFSDLATPGFTLGILLEIVRPGEKWDAFYAALVQDFNISTEFPPSRFDPQVDGSFYGTDDRADRIELLCHLLRGERFYGTNSGHGDITDLERRMAEEYLAVIRRLLDHPAVLDQARKTYSGMRSR